MQAVIYLLFANAVMHIISLVALKEQKAPNRMGVLVFAIINAAICILLMQGFAWAKWPALIFPAIGFTGLSLTINWRKGEILESVIINEDQSGHGFILNDSNVGGVK
jgi:hypothetical protein